ncbi:MAG: hypothetical protein ACTHMM_22360 [Agriterribacter sp.]
MNSFEFTALSGQVLKIDVGKIVAIVANDSISSSVFLEDAEPVIVNGNINMFYNSALKPWCEA